MEDLLKATWAFVETSAKVALGFVRRYPVHLIAAVVVVIAANQLINYVSKSAEREITVYVGPPGSSSYRMRERIADAIKGISTTPGFHYRAVVVPTTGYIDIEHRLSDDITGQAIGMAVDGVRQDESLRTLLPLDWDYLHVIASVRFLQRIRANANDSWPQQFSEVMPHLKYDRVFSGAQESGTRKFAAMMFGLHDKSIDDYASPAITDWEQALPALKADRIDLAFYCGPLLATTVEEVAKNGSAVLLGLDDLRGAMLRHPDIALTEVSIPANLYTVTPLKPPTDTLRLDSREPVAASDSKPLYFANRDLATVAARRLIVTSSRMSDQDAYYITAALTDRLIAANDIGPNTWERASPNTPPARLDRDFGIRTHRGAALHRDGVGLVSWWRPTTWPSNWQSMMLGVMTLVSTTFLHTTVKWLRHRDLPTGAASTSSSRAASAAEASPEYLRLMAQCEALLDELTSIPESIAPGERQRIVELIRALRADIRAKLAAQQISSKESNELLDAHRKLLAELWVISPEHQPADPVLDYKHPIPPTT